jgi:hypothetical protein
MSSSETKDLCKATLFPLRTAITCPNCARDSFVSFHQDSAGAYVPDEKFITCGCECTIEAIGFTCVEARP